MINKDERYWQAVKWIASKMHSNEEITWEEMRHACDMTAWLHHQPDRVGDDYSSRGDEVWYDAIAKSVEMWISYEATDGIDPDGPPPTIATAYAARKNAPEW